MKTHWLLWLSLFSLGCERKIPGTSGAECLASGLCDEGLECSRSKVCVAIDGGVDSGVIVIVTPGIPQVTITALTKTVNTATFALTGTAVDDVKVSKVEYKKAGEAFQEAALTGTNYMATVAVPEVDKTSFEYVVRVTSSRGVTAEASTMVSVDRKAPVVTYKSPAVGPVIGAKLTQLVVVTATDAALANVKVNNILATAAATASDFQADVPLPQNITQMFPLTYSAEDEAGNVATGSVLLSIDNEGPTVTFLTPATGTVFGGPATPTLAPTVTAPGALSVTINQMPATGAGPYTATVSAPANQDYVDFDVVAEAKDEFGNVGRATKVVKVDNVAPRVQLSMPSNGQKFNLADVSANGFAVRMSWNVTDGAPTAAQVKVNGGAFEAVTGDAFNVPTQATDNAGGTTGSGSYAVEVKVTDSAGNTQSVPAAYQVDRVPPRVTLQYPTEGELQVISNALIYAVFSEQMDTASSGLDWTIADPDAPTSFVKKEWSGGVTSLIRALPPGTGVRLTVPTSAKDTFGNPVIPVAPVNFTTEVIAPPAGVLLADVTKFEIASDKLGLGILTYVQGGVSKAAWFRPDGTLAPNFMEVPAKAYLPLTYATNTDGTLGTLYRVSTVQVNESGSFYQMSFSGSPWKTSTAKVTSIERGRFPILGVPPLVGETGTDKIAIIDQETSSYKRFTNGVLGTFGTSGGTSIDVSVRSPERVAHSDSRWFSIGIRGIGRSYCDKFSCPFGICKFTRIDVPAFSFSSAAISPRGTCAFAVKDNKIFDLDSGLSSGEDFGFVRTLAPYSGPDGQADKILWVTVANGSTLLGTSDAATVPCTLPYFLTYSYQQIPLAPDLARVAQLGTSRALLYLDGTNLTIRYW
jgi:hypothetical protein